MFRGRITARGAGQTAAKVTIDAGIGNTAKLSGKIDVSGLGPGQVGGAATVTGGAVQVASGARIDARGTAGGGTVRLGGGPHGKDQTVRNARTTTIAPGAVIDASATGSGNGGQVTVWADDSTVFNGSILARGGPKRRRRRVDRDLGRRPCRRRHCTRRRRSAARDGRNMASRSAKHCRCVRRFGDDSGCGHL